MAKYLVTVSETYRFDSEEEATNFIEESKHNGNYILVKYNCEHKERKAKGEVIDEWYRVTLTKSVNDEKEPITGVMVEYHRPGENIKEYDL